VTIRWDKLLHQQGLFPSRARAQGAVKAGLVKCDGKVLAKVSRTVEEDCEIEVLGDVHPFVSRAGMKLDHALQHFDIDIAGRTVLDVGASTGGFCDVCLRRDVAMIYAVDVGHNQLHSIIAKDARVISLEGVNGRTLDKTIIPKNIDLLVSDVSFISLEKTLPASMALCRAPADLVVLIKPQFEVGSDNLGKGGIVKDPALHIKTCDRLRNFVNAKDGWQVQDIINSPISGSDGNIEFLMWATLT
jgi:23S rRNA (cytidine1920-2'-O)/16S rRNA (cytidine1409-2'-O)-methyltransferase